MTLSPIAPARSVSEVLERFAAIDAALVPADGAACFNRLYRKTTEEVLAALDSAQFEDASFMERLDVLFANRYFAALDAWERGEGASSPRAWAALLESRARRGVAPLQFAMAGMNAHINYDLGLAYVDTCAERGLRPERGDARHRDYLRINEVLAVTEPRVKRWFVEGTLARIDDALGSADDAAAMWSIARARDAAFTHAETVAALAVLPPLASAYVTSLDRLVGMAGRGLLVPTAIPVPAFALA